MALHAARTGILLSALLLAAGACASSGERLVDRAGRAAEREAGRRVDRGVRAGADAAEEVLAGERSGDANSAGPAAAPDAGRGPSSQDPDYTRGDRPLFFEDYGGDVLGDFPRNLRLVEGNWDVVERAGRRWLRGTGGRGSAFQVVLPESLPERFTVEYELMYTHPNQNTALATSPLDRPLSYEGTLIQVRNIESGARMPSARREFFSRVTDDPGETLDTPTLVRIMVDGRHMKVFVGDLRVSNVPDAEILRSDRLHFQDLNFSNPDNPIYVGVIRVDAGGRDLYDALSRDGRVALEGIHFDTGSDALRAESHEALASVAAMLSEHPDLALSVEGHTDDQGDEAANLDLSRRRAEAVRRYLVDTLGVEPGRLASTGWGESRPVASNGSAEGRQRNRRVELVVRS